MIRDAVDYGSLDQWASEVEVAWLKHKRSAWEVADLVVWGLDAFTDGSKGSLEMLLDLLSEQLEVSSKTISNYVRVAKAFPKGFRWDSLELAHHEVVVKLSDEERVKWLQAAAEQGWTVKKLRLEVNNDSVTEPGEPIPLPHRLAVERAFYKAGVKANIAPKKFRFELPSGTLVGTSEADIQWAVE